MRVTIKKMGINGEGIGYIDRLPVFVPGALLNEEAEIKVIERTQRYARAKVEKIIKRSDKRVRPACGIQHRCGACPYMVCADEEQLRFKRDNLRQSLIKYAQIDPKLISEVRPSPAKLHYRNQFKLPLSMQEGELVNGMYMPNSNIFVPMETCLIHEEGLEALRKAILAVLNRHGIRAYDWHQKRGLRHLVVRGFEGRYQCTLVTGEEQLPQELIDDLLQLEGLVSLWQSIQTAKKTPDIFGPKMILLGGQRSLTMHLHGLRIPISPRSFFQLNTAQAANLYACIDAMVEPGCKRIVEAYSGIGGISMYLKDKAEEVIGIEIIKDAVLDARKAAERNGIHNVEFICADAADKLTYLSKKKSIDVLVVDPPRSGLDDLMLETMLRSRITKIIYVSCNPSTLAKNLAVLSERYEVRQIVPFDMFPHTANLETVVLLSKGEIDSKKVRVEFSLEDMDMSGFQKGATYEQIKTYVLEHTGLKVSSLYISQIKRKCGLDVGQNYNLSKKEDAKVPQCPPEKEAAIMEALKYFQMI